MRPGQRIIGVERAVSYLLAIAQRVVVETVLCFESRPKSSVLWGKSSVSIWGEPLLQQERRKEASS